MVKNRRGRGEGSIRQRADGLWHGRISLGKDGANRRRRQDVYGRTKAEVLEKLELLKGQVRSGGLPCTSALTVGQLLDKWLEATKKKTAARTHEERERHIRVHLKPRLGAARLSKLHALHIEGLYSELARDEVGAGAIRSAADTLSIALNYAVKVGLIPANPARSIDKPRIAGREMTCLDEEQSKQLLAACTETVSGHLIALALWSGCRQGELLALAWRDVDVAAGKLHIRKSLSWTKAGPILKEPKTPTSKRTVTLSAAAVKLLKTHRELMLRQGRISGPVFCTRGLGYLERKNVLRALRVVLRAAGLPLKLRFHDLRHTMASLLLSRGHSLKAVSKRLGHANPAMTLRVYAHCLPDDDEKLADGLGVLFG